MYCDQRSQYIGLNSKKNSFRGNYMRKYGMLRYYFMFMKYLRKFGYVWKKRVPKVSEKKTKHLELSVKNQTPKNHLDRLVD